MFICFVAAFEMKRCLICGDAIGIRSEENCRWEEFKVVSLIANNGDRSFGRWLF